MSIIYRAVIECDACGAEEDMQDSPTPIEKAPPLARGWEANVVDEDSQAEYGHACSSCTKEIKERNS